MNPRVVTFGEIMLRLSPPGRRRIGQAGSFDALYGGGEANVAVSLAVFGLPAEFVTRLPLNDLGLTVSCDLNYRAKLWKWGRSAGEVMTELVELCDLAVANEEDAEKIFGIAAADTDVSAGKVTAEKYVPVCEKLAGRFPRLQTIAVTLCGSIPASHNTWSAAIWQKGGYYHAPTYDIPDIVDRAGAGDSFAAGLIYALNRPDPDPQRALEFAAASSRRSSIVGSVD